ncbi:MAG TPA: oligosaccharide flippase family protein [Rubrobacter sp.]|nr:oligosaccharide flippase family protein [Rubrobacter sp.]
MKFLSRSRVTQSAGAGSVYIAVSFGVSWVLTFAFQGLSTRFLGVQNYAPLALLWSATFLTVQVLWVGATQTLGRYVAEREAKGEDWEPVVVSVRRWQIGLSGVFLLGALLASPALTNLFGSVWLTVAFVAAVLLYAPEYFRRGVFNGHRQPLRLGVQIVAESAGRVLIAAVLLVVGWGVFGPAIAIVLAPLIGVLAVRPARVPPPKGEGQPFSTGHALQFAAPVLACMAFAQALMNGGPILADLIGGTRAQVSLFAAALIFTRIPQYVLSPAIGALLPRASRVLSTDGRAAFERFLLRALGVVGLVGVLMVGGTWLLGGWGLRLFAGEEFVVERAVLVALAAMAAFYLLSETVSQGLFALGRGRIAALGWFVGLLASAVCLVTLGVGVVERVSYSLALGTLAATVMQTLLYLASRGRADGTPR